MRSQRATAAPRPTDEVGLMYVPPPGAYQETSAPPAVRTPPSAPANEEADAEAAREQRSIAQSLLWGFWGVTGRAIAFLVASAAHRAQKRAERPPAPTPPPRATPYQQAAVQAPSAPWPGAGPGRPIVAQRRAEPQPWTPPPRPRPDLDDPVRVGDLSWQQLFYVYSVVLSLFVDVWILDGAFTVIGLVQSILPVTPFGIGIAILLHLLASWGQRSLIFDPLWMLRALGVGLLVMNVIANVVGLRLALAILAPTLAGTLPLNPWEWATTLAGVAWGGIMGQPVAVPPWAPMAVILVGLASSLAWFAEPMVTKVHRRWRSVCQQR